MRTGALVLVGTASAASAASAAGAAGAALGVERRGCEGGRGVVVAP